MIICSVVQRGLALVQFGRGKPSPLFVLIHTSELHKSMKDLFPKLHFASRQLAVLTGIPCKLKLNKDV